MQPTARPVCYIHTAQSTDLPQIIPDERGRTNWNTRHTQRGRWSCCDMRASVGSHLSRFGKHHSMFDRWTGQASCSYPGRDSGRATKLSIDEPGRRLASEHFMPRVVPGQHSSTALCWPDDAAHSRRVPAVAIKMAQDSELDKRPPVVLFWYRTRADAVGGLAQLHGSYARSTEVDHRSCQSSKDCIAVPDRL